MPIYSFENIKTGKEYTEHLSMSELDAYLKNNKNIRQVFTSLNIIGGVAGLTHKNDSGWQDNLQRIAEAHPSSPLGQRYKKKGIKEIRTQQVLEKHKKRLKDLKKNGKR
jgi:hypothetical protein